MSWSEVPADIQTLITFLNAYSGGVLIVFCVVMAVLLLVPYRQGAGWAIYAVPSLLLVYCAASASSMWPLMAHAHSQPPMDSVAVIAVTTILAFLLSRNKDVQDKSQ
ncbi:hypothetical protein QGM61_06025 [Pseudohongiella sp. SYSU M77423]|uniref:hypothetical protein n=1 Tax=Pseudohongiella sp. SYSU M77423 TaxID=3042312 RepID=UPI002481012B|nr:hypothetical protein [Pseudohongiella sp. SYSU M77423]MDH7943371.1 hypothetical protein [Pseudohongiella sp. SYSU M77423]